MQKIFLDPRWEVVVTAVLGDVTWCNVRHENSIKRHNGLKYTHIHGSQPGTIEMDPRINCRLILKCQNQNSDSQVLSACDTWQWRRMLNKRYFLRAKIFRHSGWKFYVLIKSPHDKIHTLMVKLLLTFFSSLTKTVLKNWHLRIEISFHISSFLSISFKNHLIFKQPGLLHGRRVNVVMG